MCVGCGVPNNLMESNEFMVPKYCHPFTIRQIDGRAVMMMLAAPCQPQHLFFFCHIPRSKQHGDGISISVPGILHIC